MDWFWRLDAQSQEVTDELGAVRLHCRISVGGNSKNLRIAHGEAGGARSARRADQPGRATPVWTRRWCGRGGRGRGGTWLRRALRSG